MAQEQQAPPQGWSGRFLNGVEWLGNKLPDPAILFLICLLLAWAASATLASVEFTEEDPKSIRIDVKTGERTSQPLRVKDQLTGTALATFMTKMVENFAQFPPLGLVLVALLGVGVAEHTGFINSCLKALLSITPNVLLTPMLLFVALLSHLAGDSGYVLVIPLGGVIFYAAGRHPLAGIATAFAGVAGGFSASAIPTGLDPLLQGFTQSAAQIVDREREVNALCNWWFTAGACLPIVLSGWYVTDKILEPRLRKTPIDGDPAAMPAFDPLTSVERRGLWAGLAVMLAGGVLLAVLAVPGDSVLRDEKTGSLSSHHAPLMRMLVPLIFLFFLFPGIVYGYAAGTVKSHRDIVKGMSKSMATMGYYLVLVFFAAQFIYAFNQSNLGALLAVKGAGLVEMLGVPPAVTIVCLILFTTLVNLLIGSASAKWALLSPIFVPMLMYLGLSPELTQAAYRVGDSCTNIITPLNPYFALVVMYCQRYVKGTGIGTLVSLMLPFSVVFLLSWTGLLMVYWALDIPLGLDAGYGCLPPAR